MPLESDIEPRNNSTETETFQQNFEHIQKEIKELSDADQSNDVVEGIDWILTEEFSNYLLKQNSDILNNLYTNVCNYAKNSNDSNLSKLQNFLEPIILIDGISKSANIEKIKVNDYVINNVFPKYGYKIGNKLKFIKYISNEIKGKTLDTILKDLEDKETNSVEFDEFIESYLWKKSLTFTIPHWTQLHWDLSQSKYLTTCVSYYPDSFGDNCILPEWFNPQKLFEDWKSIWLGIETVHKKYNWNWIEVAIIDNPLATHNDIIPTEQISSWKNPQFHWSAVASVFVGKETWVAPNANLHYVEASSEIEDRDIYENLSKLKDKGIKVISMSFNLYDEWMFEPEEIKKWTKDKISWLVKELKESWTRALSWDEFIKNFWILGKKNPMWDSDDFQNYQVTWPDKRSLDIREKYLNTSEDSKNPKEKFMHDFYAQTKPIEDLIFINSGDRTVADPNWPDSYRHDAIWGTSWTIPAVAWYYTLACQADPQNMNPEKFMQLARDTAKLVPISDIPKDMNHMNIWKTSMQATIKVLDINALIQKIEEERNK